MMSSLQIISWTKNLHIVKMQTSHFAIVLSICLMMAMMAFSSTSDVVP